MIVDNNIECTISDYFYPSEFIDTPENDFWWNPIDEIIIVKGENDLPKKIKDFLFVS